MRKILTFLFAALMSASMFALTPKGSDTWDETTKTLTVNSNPGDDAYNAQTEIEHVIINNGVTSIGNWAFYYCTGLTSIEIPNSVTSIGDQAFRYCSGLTSVTIPNGVIGTYAFGTCTGLTSVTIGNSVTSIGEDAFEYCTGLISVTIGNSVESIGEIAFYGCTSITDVYCYPNAADLTWDDQGSDGNFKESKATVCHVYAGQLSAYQTTFPYANVTFEDDLDAYFFITANEDPDNAGVYYSTFYDSSNKYALPSGVEAFIVTAVSGDAMQLKQIAVAGQTIPEGAGVILKATSEEITLSLSEAEAESAEGNVLQGVDAQTALASAPGYSAGCTFYVLSGHSTDNSETGLGFYIYEGENITAHKAYVVAAAAGAPPRRMRFVYDQATGVENVQGNVQSTKVLRDGQLIIIRNGVEYNANGMMVK